MLKAFFFRKGGYVVFLLLMMHLLVLPSYSDTPRRSITIDHLTEVLQSKDSDRIIESLRATKRLYGRNQSIMLDFLMDLWAGRKNKHPSLPWKLINSDLVKIEVADVLLQSRKNRAIEFETEDFESYLYSKFDSRNQTVIVRAANVLGHAETERSVEILHKEAKRKDRNMFRLAVIVLTRMCNPNAGVAVEALLNEPLAPSKREFLVETKRKRDEMKRQIHLCDRW